MRPMRHEPTPDNVPRGREMTADEVLALFAPSTRAAVGMLLWALAPDLAGHDEAWLSRRGLAIAGEATGLLSTDDVKRVKNPDIGDTAATVLCLIETDQLWAREVGP